MLVCGEREAMVMAPTPMRDSAVSPWLPGFPPQGFPTTVFSFVSTWFASLQSTVALALGLLTIPRLQLPAAVSSSGPTSLSRVYITVSRTIWCSFHLAATDLLFHSQPQIFLLWLRQLPWCGDWNPASVLPPTESRSSPSNTPVFPPSFFILLSFAWFYVFSSSQLVLCMHFCVWMCIPDVYMERDVFHIHPLLPMLSVQVFIEYLNMYLTSHKWLELYVEIRHNPHVYLQSSCSLGYNLCSNKTNCPGHHLCTCPHLSKLNSTSIQAYFSHVFF